MSAISPEPEYSDDYPTCSETFATLRVCSSSHDAKGISSRLGLEPTRHTVSRRDGRTIVWLLTSKGTLVSRDCRRHVDWLLDLLGPSADQLSALRREGAEADVICYWVSNGKAGGPWLSPRQLTRLGAHGISIWWDIYFENATDKTDQSE